MLWINELKRLTSIQVPFGIKVPSKFISLLELRENPPIVGHFLKLSLNTQFTYSSFARSSNVTSFFDPSTSSISARALLNFQTSI